MNVCVQALQGSALVGSARRLTSETERDVSGFFWKGNRTVLFEKDFNGDENFHVLAVDAETATVIDLTPFENTRAGVQDDLEDDPDHILISHNQRQTEVFDVYRANVHSGELTLVAQNPGNIVGWQTDHAGRVRIGSASDGLHTSLLYRDDESRAFTPIITTDFRTSVSPAFFTFDDHSLYALSNRGRDCLALVIIDPARPEHEQMVYSVDGADLDGAAFSRARKVLASASSHTAKQIGRAHV